MADMYVEDSGGEFERCPTGVHLARCYRIIDLGTQKTEYMGQEKFQHKISLGWEVHAVDDNGHKLFMKDGRPFAIFKNYTLSWSEKANLRLDLQAWRGRPFTPDEMRRFNVKSVLGAWCMINCIEREGRTGKTYVNVGGISPVPSLVKQQGLPKAINANEFFVISEPDMALFETFSQNLKTKIQASPEWQKAASKPTQTADDSAFDDDIPF